MLKAEGKLISECTLEKQHKSITWWEWNSIFLLINHHKGRLERERERWRRRRMISDKENNFLHWLKWIGTDQILLVYKKHWEGHIKAFFPTCEKPNLKKTWIIQPKISSSSNKRGFPFVLLLHIPLLCLHL